MSEAAYIVSTFRVVGKSLELLLGSQWVLAIEIMVIPNLGDLALDVVPKEVIRITQINKPIHQGACRIYPENDIGVFYLQSGEILVLGLTSALKEILKSLKVGPNSPEGAFH